MRNKTFQIIIFALFLVTSYQLLVTNSVHAFEIDLPIISPETTVGEDESIAAYIVRIYWFAVGAAGIVAVAVIVGGAIYYMVSSGSPDKQNDAKSYITSALWGVALLLGSYLILNTINPQIVALKPPGGNLPDCPAELGSQRVGIDCLPVPPKALPYCSIPLAAGEVEGETCLRNPFAPPEGVACSPSCFFDPTKPVLDAHCSTDDLRAVCVAIDTLTDACRDNDPYPCICPDCKVIPDIIPIKQTDTCLNSSLRACFLAEDTMRKLGRAFVSNRRFFRDNFSLDKWRITEAFPPDVDHKSSTHYNGRAFDIAHAGGPVRGCFSAKEMAKRFANAGFSIVLIEGPRGVCADLFDPDEPGAIEGFPGVRRLINEETAFHIHVAD